MYTDKLEVHILELPKLSKFEYPKTELLEWAHFFAAESKEEFEMLANENTYINKAYDRLTTLSADEKNDWNMKHGRKQSVIITGRWKVSGMQGFSRELS